MAVTVLRRLECEATFAETRVIGRNLGGQGWCLVLLETIVRLSGVGCGCECRIAVTEAACPAHIWLVLVEHDRECRSNVRWSMRTCLMAHELFGRVLYGILYAARLSEVSPSVGME